MSVIVPRFDWGDAGRQPVRGLVDLYADPVLLHPQGPQAVGEIRRAAVLKVYELVKFHGIVCRILWNRDPIWVRAFLEESGLLDAPRYFVDVTTVVRPNAPEASFCTPEAFLGYTPGA